MRKNIKASILIVFIFSTFSSCNIANEESNEVTPKGPFITKWDITNNRLHIPFSNTGDCDFQIDWGDGNKDHITGMIHSGIIEHLYSENGEYKVIISGVIPEFGYANHIVTRTGKLLDVLQWGTAQIRDGGSQFSSCEYLTGFSATDIPDTSNISNMAAMFYGAKKFNGDISGWNTSNVRNMDNLFCYASAFNQNISRWNTSRVTHMGGVFSHATSFNRDISNWDTSNVIYMSHMFSYASSFNQNISKWDTSRVTRMGSMFYKATAFNCGGIDISKWKWDLANCKANDDMFYGSILHDKEPSWYK